jgi:hypothetical protein
MLRIMSRCALARSLLPPRLRFTAKDMHWLRKSFGLLAVAISVAAVLRPNSSSAQETHPLFLAVTIDDFATVKSVCESQNTIEEAKPGVVKPHATTDLHISLVEFASDTLTEDQAKNLDKLMKGVVKDLAAKYHKIKLADEIKSAKFKIFQSGWTVYQLDPNNFTILKDIADRSRKAVKKAGIAIAVKSGNPPVERDDFNLKHPDAHMSFGKFDKSRSAELRKTFVAFSGVKAGQVSINPPDATDNLGLYEIDLKQNQGGHYVNVNYWILPEGGNPHGTPKPCSP